MDHRIITDLLVPCLLLAISCVALAEKKNVYSLLTDGAAEGLSTVVQILPALIILLTAVSMLRASGMLAQMTSLLDPLFRIFGIPSETAPLVLIRPISGSAALAVGTEIM